MLSQFVFSPVMDEGSFSPSTCASSLLDIVHSVWAHGHFDFISLIMNERSRFLVMYPPIMCLLLWNVCSSIFPISWWICSFSFWWTLWRFYVPGTLAIVSYLVCKSFCLYAVGCLFFGGWHSVEAGYTLLCSGITLDSHSTITLQCEAYQGLSPSWLCPRQAPYPLYYLSSPSMSFVVVIVSFLSLF